MKALRIALAAIRKADNEFNLFKENTRICIGISGGKDSMSLFYCLDLYKKYSKINFEIVPMMIDLGFPNSDFRKIKEYFKSLNYSLHIEDSKQVYEILKIQKEKQNLKILPCSICSKMKKAIINKVAHKLNCSYVSFAHHKNDAIETLFLNEIYGGRIATFSPKMYLTKEKITFIRPFIYLDESIIKRLVKENNIPYFPSSCPNDKHTQREEIKNLLSLINEKYSSSSNNFLKMLINEPKIDIFSMHNEYKIENSSYYLKRAVLNNDLKDEIKYLNKKISLNKKIHHIHIYEDSKIVGVIYLLKIDKKITIKIPKIEKFMNLDLIIADLFNKVFAIYNPIDFNVTLTKSQFKNIKNLKIIDKTQDSKYIKFKLENKLIRINKII